MLNEKNKYIKTLKKKINKLNDLVFNSKGSEKRLGSHSKTRASQSPTQVAKSRSNNNMQRAKSA